MANRNISTAPLSNTGLSGSVRLCMSLSPSEPVSFSVTYRTETMQQHCSQVYHFSSLSENNSEVTTATGLSIHTAHIGNYLTFHFQDYPLMKLPNSHFLRRYCLQWNRNPTPQDPNDPLPMSQCQVLHGHPQRSHVHVLKDQSCFGPIQH